MTHDQPLSRRRPAAEAGSAAADEAALLARLRQALPAIADDAAGEDQSGCFPVASWQRLVDAGLLSAPLQRSLGGGGWGSEAHGAPALASALRLIGRASLPLGRLYEGHVNALRLVQRHGTPAQRRQAAADATAGQAFAIWNTDPPQGPGLRLAENGRLQGTKVLCSGAGHVQRALVTYRPQQQPDAPPQLALVPLLPGQGADASSWTAQGMRASVSGSVAFDGLRLEPVMRIGIPGDYLRQPDLAVGAWRFLAVQCGGIDAIGEALRQHLRRTGRGDDPHQARRLAQVAIAAQTAWQWVERAAPLAEAADAGQASIAFVNIARHAVEAAAVRAMQLAQKSVGLAAFLAPHPLDRLCRDLATYLRQPAPDAALMAAAQYLLQQNDAMAELWGQQG